MSELFDRREALVAGAGALLLPRTPALSAERLPTTSEPVSARRDQPFDEDWLFRRGEMEGQEQPTLDDAAWQRIDLPHDWSIEDAPSGAASLQVGPFDEKAVGGSATGFTNGGEGWYRKRFSVDHLPADTRLLVEFDGVSVECETWINGVPLGKHRHGYAPFWFDLTEHLVRARDNVLALRVRNLGSNSRWYAGSGLYRQVRLHTVPNGTRIAQWGVAAWTRRIVGGVARVDVTTTIDGGDSTALLVTRLRDASGRIVAQASAPAIGAVRQQLSVRGAHLWSPGDPYLHRLESEIHRGGAVVDRMVQPIGLRIVAMDSSRGLTVNGERIVLRGGCIHHDNGLLGACAFADSDERRLRLLKARGYNAIRSSHNPASRTLRQACDELGMLLIEEAFDMWHVAKLPDDHARNFPDDWRQVIDAMIRSARNNASVIMWSVGNEIPDRSTPEGMHWAWLLANRVREIDPTRPVTAALNGVLGPLMKADTQVLGQNRPGKPDNASTLFLDVAGYNYRLDDFERDHSEHPARIMYASESYASEAWDYVTLTKRAPYVLGEFVWSALDYIGEAGIGGSAVLPIGKPPSGAPSWPWVISWCGDLDLIGDQKPASRFRDVAWDKSLLEIAVQRPLPAGNYEFISPWGWSDELPSWTWPGMEGQSLNVRLYTPGDKVELRLNGTKVGEAPLTPAHKLRAEIKVPFAPGRLEAVAFRGGREIARRQIETVGPPTRLRLTPERPVAVRGRQTLCYIGVEVLDAHGRLVLDAERRIRLEVSGPVRLIGFGNGNPQATGSFRSVEAKSFRGRAMAILRATDDSGEARIEARGDGLAGGMTRVRLV